MERRDTLEDELNKFNAAIDQWKEKMTQLHDLFAGKNRAEIEQFIQAARTKDPTMSLEFLRFIAATDPRQWTSEDMTKAGELTTAGLTPHQN
jgi:hypothetical protein